MFMELMKSCVSKTLQKSHHAIVCYAEVGLDADPRNATLDPDPRNAALKSCRATDR